MTSMVFGRFYSIYTDVPPKGIFFSLLFYFIFIFFGEGEKVREKIVVNSFKMGAGSKSYIILSKSGSILHLHENWKSFFFVVCSQPHQIWIPLYLSEQVLLQFLSGAS